MFNIGVNKTGYLTPFLVQLKDIPSVLLGPQVIAKFDSNKALKSVGHITVQKDGTIEGITSEIIALMRIDKEYIKKKGWKLQDLLPEVWEEIHPFEEKGMYKKHMTSIFQYPQDSEYNKNLLVMDKSTTVKLKIRIHPMYIKRLSSTKAYILRIEQEN